MHGAAAARCRLPPLLPPLLLLVLAASLLLTPALLSHGRGLLARRAAAPAPDGAPDGVRLWVPHGDRCAGTFAARLPGQGAGAPVALVVREAAVDRRHVSVAEFRARHRHRGGDYRRVLVLMTVVPDAEDDDQTYIGRSVHVRGRAEHMRSAELREGGGGGGRAAEGLAVSFDYLREDGLCERNCKVHNPCRVREWQAVVTITPAGGRAGAPAGGLGGRLEDLAAGGAFLRLRVPVEARVSKRVEPATVDVALSCVADLTAASAMPHMPHMPPRRDLCADARGAVQTSGGALFGARRWDPLAWRDVAHFAARHLHGHTYYDTVAVALLPEYPVAEILHRCAADAGNRTCAAAHHDANRAYMRAVRGGVERELAALGVARGDWSRVVLFLFCRLGTDFLRSEAGAPCDASHHAGQKPLGHIAYTAFAPHHRWASNFDIDEFLFDEAAPPRAPAPAASARLRSAASRFDDLRKATGREEFYTLWLDFRVAAQDLRAFTRRVMHGQAFEFMGYGGATLNVNECYDGGGKVAVSCVRSAGFMVHFGLSLRNALDLGSATCVPRRDRSPSEAALYSYHIRDPPRQGHCMFNATAPAGDKCVMNPRETGPCAPS